jgi:hypothetical protein
VEGEVMRCRAHLIAAALSDVVEATLEAIYLNKLPEQHQSGIMKISEKPKLILNSELQSF